MPFWHMDTAMASLLILQTATDDGLGACFIGIPPDQEAAVRAAFGIPDDHDPVGVITIGHPRRDAGAAGSPTRRRRKPTADVVHRGRWVTPRPVHRRGLRRSTRRTTARSRIRDAVRRSALASCDRDPTAPSRKLQALVRIPTVSHRDRSQVDTAAFDAFVAELARAVPAAARAARADPGRHPRAALPLAPARSAERPVVLMAHLDVVPVDDGAPWQHPPFGAEIVDGAIWGRGTLDDKGPLVAICEAVETLLEQDFTPAQDVWLSFGCDEEVSGTRRGAGGRGARRGAACGRGSSSTRAARSPHEAFPGVAAPIGVIGVTEKGVTSLELRVEGRGGHASTPGPQRPDRPAGPRDHPARPPPMPASLPGPDRRAVPPDGAARPARRCAR